MPSALERALARFRPHGRPRTGPGGPPSGRRRPDGAGDTEARVSAAAFRAATEQRLRGLEREVAEVKGRINGLILVVASAVITQVVLRLAG